MRISLSNYIESHVRTLHFFEVNRKVSSQGQNFAVLAGVVVEPAVYVFIRWLQRAPAPNRSCF